MRLVVTGPVGAGKSTFIRSVSEIEVVDTDRKATDETALLKEGTTVAMDFGKLQFGEDMVLHLYGTPGQSRFDFMWDILISKANAYILLVAANRPHEFRYAKRIMNFMNQRSSIPIVVGLTHTDDTDAWDEENIALALGFPHKNNRPPIVRVNPRESASVIKSLITLIEQLMTNSKVTI